MKKLRHRIPLLDWFDVLIASVLAAAALALFVRTLVPGLIPNDSAEFQTLAYTMDHAHTTGYEVYVLLAKFFTWLVPVGDIAYRINLLSAVCAALTAGLVYLNGRVFSGSRWGGIFGAATLAVSTTFWSQAIIAEVYSMGSVFTAAVLLLVLIWHETGSARTLFAAGMLGGLAIGVHGSVMLLVPAILLLFLLRIRDLHRFWKPALGGAAMGLLLMGSIFAVVDFQETSASMMNTAYKPSITRWGLQPGDLDSFGQRFAFLVGARQWRSAMFVNPEKVVPENMKKLAAFYQEDFALPFRLLVWVGLVGIFLRRWRLGAFLAAAVLAHWIYTFNYRIGDIYVFFISLYVYYSVLAAEGIAVLLRALNRFQGTASRIAQPALALILLAGSIAPVYAQRVDGLRAGELRFQFMELPSNQALEDWHALIRYNVKALPQNAIVLMPWHDLYGYAYTAHVEQNRPDLLFMEAYPYANTNGMADSLLEYLTDALSSGRPVYTLLEFEELRRGGLDYHRESVGISQMFKVEKR